MLYRTYFDKEKDKFIVETTEKDLEIVKRELFGIQPADAIEVIDKVEYKIVDKVE